jgi:hypothetical protein
MFAQPNMLRLVSTRCISAMYYSLQNNYKFLRKPIRLSTVGSTSGMYTRAGSVSDMYRVVPKRTFHTKHCVYTAFIYCVLAYVYIILSKVLQSTSKSERIYVGIAYGICVYTKCPRHNPRYVHSHLAFHRHLCRGQKGGIRNKMQPPHRTTVTAVLRVHGGSR